MKPITGIVFTIILLLVAVLALRVRPEAPVSPSQPQLTSTPTATPEAQNQNPRHASLILEEPQESQAVSSPLSITGMAKGEWFFEATFPVVLTDWDGLIIAEGYATADGDWMSEEFVRFTSELTFTTDTAVSNRGSLILQKANPSGLPENDDAYEITVFFE